MIRKYRGFEIYQRGLDFYVRQKGETIYCGWSLKDCKKWVDQRLTCEQSAC